MKATDRVGMQLRFGEHNEELHTRAASELSWPQAAEAEVKMLPAECRGFSHLASRSYYQLQALKRNGADVNKKHVIFIPSKGNADKAHLNLGPLLGPDVMRDSLVVLVVEPQDAAAYARRLGKDQLMAVLDKDSQGVAYVRQVWTVQ